LSYFLLLKFAAAAPGSDIIVVLGLLEGLGFSPAMLSLITAIYVILNPIITGANVAGDGALVIIFTKFHRRLFAREKQRALK
jgi:Na+/H+-dicarboxylate symporter